ncbi:MAG: sigma-70 family RNA polymerase sigma factor [Flavobacteriales bacterium]|nr:sigma-70 family RNA polymerase sigma factor [Flavobacteriales bacterium]
MKERSVRFLKLYEPIHEAFARFCHAKAYGVLEAEDLISESVLLALENLHRLKHDEAFLSFMFSIARNIVNNKYRRLKFMGVFNKNEVALMKDEGLNPEMKHDISVLYSCLNMLPSVQKEALILFEISGFSIKEVAEIQGSGESAIKQRLKRGREKLAKILKADRLAHESLNNRSSILFTMFL